jgi:hypothetical protein
VNGAYVCDVGEDAILTAGATLDTVDLLHDHPNDMLDASASFELPRERREVHGPCGWFVVDVGAGASIDTVPGRPATVWRQLYLPSPAR